MYKKFEPGTVLYSLTETHPKVEFFIVSGSVYYDRLPEVSGSNVPDGDVSLQNLNDGGE